MAPCRDGSHGLLRFGTYCFEGAHQKMLLQGVMTSSLNKPEQGILKSMSPCSSSVPVWSTTDSWSTSYRSSSLCYDCLDSSMATARKQYSTRYPNSTLFPFYLGVSELKWNITKKGTLIIMGLLALGNLDYQASLAHRCQTQRACTADA